MHLRFLLVSTVDHCLGVLLFIPVSAEASGSTAYLECHLTRSRAHLLLVQIIARPGINRCSRLLTVVAASLVASSAVSL